MLSFVSAYRSIGVAILTALGLGVIGVVLFSLLPTFTTYLSVILGGLGCIAAGIYILLI